MKFHLPKSTYHFSIDDVFNSLIELSDQKIPFFHHPFYRFLKEAHDKFGTNIDLYCFYQREIDGKMRTLRDVSSHIKQTIQANPWLRFGPHALDYATAPYNQKPNDAAEAFDKIYHEIKRFAGIRNFSRFIRLHYFSEVYELAEYFKSRGVEALFSTDKDVFSHRMPEKVKQSLAMKGLASYQKMNFIRTHFRVENFVQLQRSDKEINQFLIKFLDKFGFIMFFTHEYDVPDPRVKPATMVLINKCINLKLKTI